MLSELDLYGFNVSINSEPYKCFISPNLYGFQTSKDI